MKLKIKEDQINALIQFLSFAGLYYTFRLGVLKGFYEKDFDPESPEMQEYIRLYEKYQRAKINNKEEKMSLIKA